VFRQRNLTLTGPALASSSRDLPGRLSFFGLAASMAGAADQLAHFATPARPMTASGSAHTRNQPHYVGEVLGVEQLLGIVQRRCPRSFPVGNRLGADILGIGTHTAAPLPSKLEAACCALTRKFSNVLRARSKLASASTAFHWDSNGHRFS